MGNDPWSNGSAAASASHRPVRGDKGGKARTTQTGGSEGASFRTATSIQTYGAQQGSTVSTPVRLNAAAQALYRVQAAAAATPLPPDPEPSPTAPAPAVANDPNGISDTQLQAIIMGSRLSQLMGSHASERGTEPRMTRAERATSRAQAMLNPTTGAGLTLPNLVSLLEAQARQPAAPAQPFRAMTGFVQPTAPPPTFNSLFGATAAAAAVNATAAPNSGRFLAEAGTAPSAVFGGRSSAEPSTAAVFGGRFPAEPNTAHHLQEDQTITIFDGNNLTCTVCIQEFESGQRVIRLLCRHIFHGECWTRLTMAADPGSGATVPDCPNCRGLGQLIAMWDYVDPNELTQPGIPNMLAEPTTQMPAEVAHIEIITPRSVHTEYHWGTPQSTFSGIVLPSTYTDANDWVIPEEAPSSSTRGVTYHVDTRLSDGRPSLLVDPGSVGNLGGDQWAREASKAALAAQRRPEEVLRARPLDVRGVGHGSQKCTHNCRIPIMLRQLDGRLTSGTFETPIVPNSELPALLGLQSLTQARSILDLTTNQLHLCGPGTPQFELPPGSESYQLEVAPSGHLVLPCSEFRQADQHNTTVSSAGNTLALATVEQNSVSSSSGRSHAEPAGRRAASSNSGRSQAEPVWNTPSSS